MRTFLFFQEKRAKVCALLHALPKEGESIPPLLEGHGEGLTHTFFNTKFHLFKMKYLVTGATGYIGHQLTRRLASLGHSVNALYRSGTKAKELENLPGVCLHKGDLLDPGSLQRAAEGCDAVFHVAAFAKPWHKDPQTFFRINVKGAENVFCAAKKMGARRVVFTSTAGVISPSEGSPTSESSPRRQGFFTHYERSKAQAEAVAKQMSAGGFETITVNPSRVYGPGRMGAGNPANKMVRLYLQGKFRLLPGNGKSIGNYVFINDVVEGHIQAMEKGRGGERYILGGQNASFIEFFEMLAKVSGKDFRMFKMPLPLMQIGAAAMETMAKLTGTEPLLTPPWVKKYLFDWEHSTGKAERELGFEPTALEEGLRATVEWVLGG
ncbi:MAG TPA: NAD-dependent epimerase/dehydratase family protein [Bacteroidetes bacterium]|nr:NAD-dependent epimerase/dehydratase family protein [Bacteroidota bacterium]